jgi:hypothetical protein
MIPSDEQLWNRSFDREWNCLRLLVHVQGWLSLLVSTRAYKIFRKTLLHIPTRRD